MTPAMQKVSCVVGKEKLLSPESTPSVCPLLIGLIQKYSGI